MFNDHNKWICLLWFGLAGANIRIKRSEDEVDANGHCVPGRTWMDDCNQCWCTESGIAACTLKGCFHVTTEKIVEWIAPTLEVIDIETPDETGTFNIWT